MILIALLGFRRIHDPFAAMGIASCEDIDVDIRIVYDIQTVDTTEMIPTGVGNCNTTLGSMR